MTPRQAQVAADPALIDRSWSGYDPRAGFPAILLAASVSILLLVGRWALEDLSWFADQAGALVVYAVTLAIWPGLLATLCYRAITYTYRVTDRGIIIDWGFRNLPEAPVWFHELVAVEVKFHPIGRILGFGRVILRCQDGRVVALRGVANPDAFADSIRTASETFKSSQRTDSEIASSGAPR